MKEITLGVLVLALIFAVFFLGPVLILWVINSLAEAGGAKFYIEHTLWNYWVAFIGLVLLRGGSSK